MLSIPTIPYVIKKRLEQIRADITALQSAPPGSGDMMRSTYDSDLDGKIANAQLTSGVDIADAISQKHSNSLDHNGATQDSAIAAKATLAEVKADTDIASSISLKHSNSLDHDGASQNSAIVGKTTLAEVKADADVSSAITLKHSNTLDHSNSLDHTQGTDQGLDSGGANAVTAAQGKTAYTHSQAAHAPSNAQINADITKAEIEAKLTGEIASHTHAGGGGDGETSIVKPGDTVNSTVNLADAAGLSFSALANSTYMIEAFLLWDSSGTAVGIKVSASATNSPTINSGHFTADAANGTPDGSSWNANGVVVTTSASPFTAYNLGQVAAILKTAGNASTWQLRFAAETTGTITIKADSILRYRKVA